MLIENSAILSLHYARNKNICNPKSPNSDSEAAIAKDLFWPGLIVNFAGRTLTKLTENFREFPRTSALQRVQCITCCPENEHSAFKMIHAPSLDAHTSFDPNVSADVKCLRLSQRKMRSSRHGFCSQMDFLHSLEVEGK